jgi:hypothetical protein
MGDDDTPREHSILRQMVRGDGVDLCDEFAASAGFCAGCEMGAITIWGPSPCASNTAIGRCNARVSVITFVALLAEESLCIFEHVPVGLSADCVGRGDTGAQARAP